MLFIKKIIFFPYRYFKTHKIRTIVVVLGLILTIVIFRPKPTILIATQKAEPSSFAQSVSVSGKVNAMQYQDVTFQSAGKLVYLGVKKGDKVEAGQTIAVLDQRTVQKNIEMSLTDYAKQRNTFDQTKENNQNRTPEGALSDQMKRVLLNNQNDLNKAINSVEVLALAKEQSVLVSPMSGIITRADVQTPGVTVGLTTTFTIVNPDSLTFEMDVDQADISKVKEGQKVKVTLDAYPENELVLTIDSIDFTTHLTSTGGNAYTVKASLPKNIELNYRVGMEGNAEIITAQAESVLSVPISSLDNDQLYVKTKKGYEKRKVTTGLENDISVEIRKGVNPGDEVVTEPSLVPNQNKPRKFLGIF